MSLVQDQPKTRISMQAIALCAVVVLSFLLRLEPVTGTNLWEDEIIAVTHAALPLPDLIIDSIRNDMHPPFYFLQLHGWTLLSDSDWWIVLNSTIWSVLAVLAVAFVGWRIYGTKAAVMATAVASATPMNITLGPVSPWRLSQYWDHDK